VGFAVGPAHEVLNPCRPGHLYYRGHNGLHPSPFAGMKQAPLFVFRFYHFHDDNGALVIGERGQLSPVPLYTQ